jgi:hypothetical protein
MRSNCSSMFRLSFYFYHSPLLDFSVSFSFSFFIYFIYFLETSFSSFVSDLWNHVHHFLMLTIDGNWIKSQPRSIFTELPLFLKLHLIIFSTPSFLRRASFLAVSPRLLLLRFVFFLFEMLLFFFPDLVEKLGCLILSIN